jgi:hypothetical protein
VFKVFHPVMIVISGGKIIIVKKIIWTVQETFFALT